MKNPNLIAAAAFISIPLGLTAATINYNDTITAIYGTGNPNTGWTSSTDASTGIEVALRGKHRVTGATPHDNAGTYTFSKTPVGSVPNLRAPGNWEFSAFSGTTGLGLDDVQWLLSVDTDPSQGVNFLTFNPFVNNPTHFYTDNSLGTSATLNGQGVENQFLNLGNFTLGQNSQNIAFAPSSQALNQDATYTYVFAAILNGNEVAKSEITMVFGAGGSPVPDAGATVGMLSLGLAGLFGTRRMFKK